ncbi:hypothetical protein GPX89_24410 [Nocardia sp. ET3-3]|uniref:Uncharacterized protein n=1 Tax=Nocardia terrae TaxID=2675851 RepID=A0A7K1V1R5_9NOCA|nr:hypothetical protein [Nocardia terrae]MVU80379.1 hypothetical protein [Nocardia terrae]
MPKAGFELALLAGLVLIVVALVADRLGLALGLLAVWTVAAVIVDLRRHPRPAGRGYFADLAIRLESGTRIDL